ncbi:MAG: DUF58 domain-containing protein [Acidobacteria bacterium]|nr:DUF58 domain-containing protein [Acidobacteriota bacterium]
MTVRWAAAARRTTGKVFAPAARLWRRYLRLPALAIIGGFPFTRTGLAFLLLFASALWFYGVLVRDLVLLVAGLGGAVVLFVLLLCTMLMAVVAGIRTGNASTPGELDLDTGIPQPTGYRLRRPRWIPFAVLDWQWVNDGGGETAARVELEQQGTDLVEMASPGRRCIVKRVVRRFAVRDLFGLTEISWRRTEEVMLRVLPYRGMLGQMPPPAGMAEGDDLSDPYAEPKGDRVEMRQYAPGDPLRMVLWKVYARSGKMMVRTPERSVAERKRGCAYLVTSPHDDATSAAARVTIERGLLGDDWSFAADGVLNEANDDREAAFEIIARSGEAHAEERAAGLASYLTRREAEGYQFCLLFIPPDQEAWDAVAAQSAATQTMRVQILTAAGEIVPDQTPPKGFREAASRWLLKPGHPDGISLAEIRSRAAAVRGLANELIAVERSSGRSLSDMLGYKG